MCLSVEDFAEHRVELAECYLDALRACGVDINISQGMVHEALCLRTAHYLSGTLLGIAFVGLEDEERNAMMDGSRLGCNAEEGQDAGFGNVLGESFVRMLA
jgi:hypothetical protein